MAVRFVDNRGAVTETAKPCQAIRAGAIATGVNFISGWPETGSHAPPTSAPMRAREANCPVQCIGANTSPGRWSSLMRTRQMVLPCVLSTHASMPSPSEWRTASAGWMARNGSGSPAISRGALPVRVIVCHWSRMRPVLSTSGKRSHTAAAGAR